MSFFYGNLRIDQFINKLLGFNEKCKPFPDNLFCKNTQLDIWRFDEYCKLTVMESDKTALGVSSHSARSDFSLAVGGLNFQKSCYDIS